MVVVVVVVVVVFTYVFIYETSNSTRISCPIQCFVYTDTRNSYTVPSCLRLHC